MKTLLLVLGFLPILSYSQAGLTSYEKSVPVGESVIIQDSVIIPVKDKKGYAYHIYPLGNNGAKRIFRTKIEGSFTFNGDYLYVHHDQKLTKYNRFSLEPVWTAEYGYTKWANYCNPEILGDKYVVAANDMHILIADKETGKVIQDIEGTKFDCDVSLSKNLLICSYEGGTVKAYNINSGEKVWSLKVGSEAGFGSLTDNNKIYIPSWDPKFYCLDQKTGKKIWTLNLTKYKNGCGSGFEETPVLVGDKLYAVHRDHGLFMIDKKTGEILDNKDDFSEIIDNIELYQEKYLLFMDTDYFYIYSTESNKILEKIKLPVKMRTGFLLQGDHVVATQDIEWKNYPYKKGVISIDLKQYIK